MPVSLFFAAPLAHHYPPDGGVFGYHPGMTPANSNSRQNPFDELPYLAYPITQMAPEHLALTSLVHGGPRLALEGYRVLELGCANGANLLPLAWFRRHGDFTGLDASARQIALANESRDKLGLGNLKFINADFRTAKEQLEGPFDIIMAHGVFSWVPDDARDAMLELSSSLLAPNGLLYLNYNAQPGWKVRGLVRDFLMRQTNHIDSLEERAEMCRQISAKVIAPLKDGEHAFTRLMSNEFKLVVDYHPAYIAHEYLSPVNRAYWREEFFEILQRSGFSYLADADFNCISNRITSEVANLMKQVDLDDRSANDAADLMCYRQMQSPVLTHATAALRPCEHDEFANLFMASPLLPVKSDNPQAMFRTPAGEEIEITDESISQALIELQAEWPRGRRIRALFTDVEEVRESLEFMLNHELIELRCIEPGDCGVSAEPLNELEKSLRNISTSPWHTMTMHETQG